MKNLLKALIFLVDEVIVVVVVLLVLPLFGIHLHWGILAGLLVIMAIITYITYRSITMISKRDVKGGIESLIGAKGKVIVPLFPDGTVKIGAETWKASSLDSHIDVGEQVVVMNCRGLTLLVKPDKGSEES